MMPKEDPEDKKARLRERRLSMLELDRSTQQNAQDMGADLRSVYGMAGLVGAKGAKLPISKPMPSVFDLSQKGGR